jgi:hypothetical protein
VRCGWRSRVVGDLADLKDGAVGEDPLLDGTVVNHVAGGRFDEARPGPEIVGHAVALGASSEVLLGHEVARKHRPEPALVLGWEHPGERGDIGRGREVEPAEAPPAAQQLERDRTITGVPRRHVDPALGLLGPLVEVHAPEGVLGARQGDRLLGFAREVVRLDREPEARVGIAPDLGIGPAQSIRLFASRREAQPLVGGYRSDLEAIYVGQDPAISSSVEDPPKLAATDGPDEVSCTTRILCL